jgi:hypothetical protein
VTEQFSAKPREHPLTDILEYGQSEFGDPVDALVKKIANDSDFASVREEVSNLLWDLSPHWLNAVPDGRQKAFIRLTAILERLKP